MVTGLSGRRAVVTGAGSGIGRAVAVALAREGATVLAVGLAPGLDETVALCASAPGNAIPLVLDVRGPCSPDELVAAAEDAAGGADILVNNAGIGGAKAAYDTEDEDLDRFIDVNLRSVFRISRGFVRTWRSRQAPGVIVNIASVQGLLGFPNNSAYALTKAGVIGLTRQMANDCAALGIRVNAVAPGIIETPLTATRLEANAEFRRVSVGATPLGRPGRPEEVAAACLFLASDAASFITGHVLAVDGGASSTVHRAEVA